MTILEIPTPGTRREDQEKPAESQAFECETGSAGAREVLWDIRGICQLLNLGWWQVGLVMFWGVVALGSGVSLAALAAWLIVRAWQMPPVLDLSVAVVAVRALGISRGVCRYAGRLLTHRLALRSMTAAREAVYRELVRGPLWLARSNHDLGRPGEVVTRMGSDIEQLGAFVVRSLVPAGVALVVSVGSVIGASLLSPAAGIVLAGSLLVSGILAPWLSARAAVDAAQTGQDAHAEFTAQAETILRHAPELQVANHLSVALHTAAAQTRRVVGAQNRTASRSAWAAATTPLVTGITVLSALVIGIASYPVEFTNDPMNFGVLVLFPLSAFEAVSAMPAAAHTGITARHAFHRLRALHNCASTSPIPNPPPLPTVPRIAIVGPSGTGKTTLLMTWAGLFGTPDPNRAFFAEDAHLFHTSLWENLRVVRGDLTAIEAQQVLGAVGLGEWLTGLPEGVHTVLNAGASSVSGGQRRRILLARALVSPARTLLLDEPTEHLEAQAGTEILQALLDENSGLVSDDKQVIVVTHQLPKNHRADLVVHVEKPGEYRFEPNHSR